MYKPNYLCDLHCHTTRSDGLDTPIELINRASEFGMKIVAITDHDLVPSNIIRINENDIDIIEYAKSKNIMLLRGAEFSCDTLTEDVHILAFGCNFDDQRFTNLQEEIAINKIKSYKQLIQILNDNGFHIDWEDLLSKYGDPMNDSSIQKKMIFQMMADKGYVDSWKEAKLLIQSKEVFNIYREKPEPVDIIRLINDTNGVSILAHPYLINHQSLDRFKYIEVLIEAGLNGIEACYPYSKTNYKGNLTDKEMEGEIKEIYGDTDLFISGGSDYHGEWQRNILDAREIGCSGISFEEIKNSIVYQFIDTTLDK